MVENPNQNIFWINGNQNEEKVNIGYFPIRTIGFGVTFVNSDNLVPNPPAKITTFIIYFSHSMKLFYLFHY